MRKSIGVYPPDWAAIAAATKEAAGWRCIRCGHPHDPAGGHTLTVHHADLDPANNRWYNLLPLCQKCHLVIQAKVILERPWYLAHSDWFKPYVAGWAAWHYLGLMLTREQVMANLDYYVSLQARMLEDGATTQLEDGGQ